jgi:hypothetical protein
MHALSPSVAAELSARGLLMSFLAVVRDAFATACGRTTLDCVEIPDCVAEVDPRTRRLVRQARVSAW